MNKLKYIKPQLEVLRFQLKDGYLYTLSDGQNGNETDGGLDPFNEDEF